MLKARDDRRQIMHGHRNISKENSIFFLPEMRKFEIVISANYMHM